METTMKTVSLLTGFFIGLVFISNASAESEPPFYGMWSCTMIHDGNTIDVSSWWQERIDADGVLGDGAQKPTKLTIRKLRPHTFALVYADGGKAQIVMKESWIFLRHTNEHGYLCLRKSQH